MQYILTFFIQKQGLIKWLFFVAYCLFFVIWLGGGYLYIQTGDADFLLYDIGSNFGTISVILYSLTLLPGILKRLRLLPQWTVIGMLFRRQVGILMFLSTFIHYSFTTMFPFVLLNEPLVLGTAQQYGFFAMIITMCMFVTSNDIAKAKMGRLWDWLQRLTYLALVLIFAHVAYMEVKWAVILGVIACAEVISWVVAMRRKA
jgi:DMSO/TMAO reductase YedYZ heme-binding membrane subunit